jgi:Protein of unknown function (DUF3631)
MSKKNFPDFSQHCEAACIKLWGEPDWRTPKQLRWNSADAYGARVYSVQKHAWYDHGQQRGGSTLELVDYAKGKPKREARGKAVFNLWREAHEMELYPEPPPAPQPTANGGGKPIVATYPYHDEDRTLLSEVVRFDTTDSKERFRQRQPDGKGGWIWNTKGVRKVLYRLPELIAAVKASERVLICEGERDSNTAVKLGYVATTMPGGVGKWRAEYDQFFIGADVVIVSDNDAPGQDHAAKLAKRLSKVAAHVRVVKFDVKDLTEWVEAGGTREQLDARIESAPEQVKPAEEQEPEQEQAEAIDVDAELERLARLTAIEYERARKGAAEKLDVRASILDRLVAEERGCAPTPPLYAHWNVAPADEPVDGGILLRAIKEQVRRYVFLSDDQAVAVTLWVAFSWLHERMTHSPLLYVTSAEKDSGKTTLCGVLNFLTWRSLQSVSITGPALFRSITKWQPTLIIDEADDALVDNVDLRDVVNSGWTRGQGAPRCHSETHEPEVFSTFAPKIVAMKGRKLPDTTLSRSVIITLRPRRAENPNEHAADFDHLDTETFARLRAQLMRWSADNIEAIVKATPEIPPGFQNRRRANWKPLLAIAEACGGEWKTAAWGAAQAIEKIADTFDASIGVELLQAIKAAFDARGIDRIISAGLVEDLVDDATAPWATYNKGKPISQRQVAKLLKPYGITPKVIKLASGSTARGYLLEWFADAFERHCTPSSPENPNSSVTSVTDLFSQENYPSPTDHPVTDKKDEKPFDNNEVTEVTDKKRVPGSKAHVQTARPKSKSDDLPYTGPVVEVPDSGPDSLSEHGAPSNGGEGHICAYCGRPGGNEVSTDGITIRLHPECEVPWIDRRMGEERIRQ